MNELQRIRPVVRRLGPAISVMGISKSFEVYKHPKDLVLEFLTGTPRHAERWALRDISFDVAHGEVVGIVGANGAGKSTLLKVIAGTLAPTSGEVKTDGRVSAILELGTGFHPEYTGRQNVITGGMCLGMSHAEIEERLPWIIDFSELGDVIDEPFRTYSSGMQARLTFATAICGDPDIFIVDEALAAGDNYFVTKCFRRIREICNSGATVVFVSHGTNQVAQLCQRAIWIDNGRIKMIDDARAVTRLYDYETHIRGSYGRGRVVSVDQEKPESANEDDQNTESAGYSFPAEEPMQSILAYRKGPVVIEAVRFLASDGRQRRAFRTWEDIAIEVSYGCRKETPFDYLGLAIGIEREKDLVLVAQFSSAQPSGKDFGFDLDETFLKRASNSGKLVARLSNIRMLEGDYLISLGILPNIPGQSDFYEYRHRAYRLKIVASGYSSGAIYYPEVNWKHEPSVKAES
jgi:ABC-type polysaccharide/polyol phosphate transport system ATPase subunit